MRALKTVTFIYEPREDRIAAAINVGAPDAWSCWLTRRLALALLERASDFVAHTSTMAQHTPSELRNEFIAFERDAAIATTSKAMTITPPEVLKTSVTAAVLADKLQITAERGGFHLELHAQRDDGAAGVLTRPELQRMLQMLQDVVGKAGWLAAPATPQAAATGEAPAAKTLRH